MPENLPLLHPFLAHGTGNQAIVFEQLVLGYPYFYPKNDGLTRFRYELILFCVASWHNLLLFNLWRHRI
jgi:hypothetical protein